MTKGQPYRGANALNHNAVCVYARVYLSYGHIYYFIK